MMKNNEGGEEMKVDSLIEKLEIVLPDNDIEVLGTGDLRELGYLTRDKGLVVECEGERFLLIVMPG